MEPDAIVELRLQVEQAFELTQVQGSDLDLQNDRLHRSRVRKPPETFQVFSEARSGFQLEAAIPPSPEGDGPLAEFLWIPPPPRGAGPRARPGSRHLGGRPRRARGRRVRRRRRPPAPDPPPGRAGPGGRITREPRFGKEGHVHRNWSAATATTTTATAVDGRHLSVSGQRPSRKRDGLKT